MRDQTPRNSGDVGKGATAPCGVTCCHHLVTFGIEEENRPICSEESLYFRIHAFRMLSVKRIFRFTVLDPGKKRETVRETFDKWKEKQEISKRKVGRKPSKGLTRNEYN